MKSQVRGQFIIRIESIAKVDPLDAHIRVDLNPDRFDVVSSVRTACEVGQIELNLVPAGRQRERHNGAEVIDAGRTLVVGGSEPSE